MPNLARYQQAMRRARGEREAEEVRAKEEEGSQREQRDAADDDRVNIVGGDIVGAVDEEYEDQGWQKDPDEVRV